MIRGWRRAWWRRRTADARCAASTSAMNTHRTRRPGRVRRRPGRRGYPHQQPHPRLAHQRPPRPRTSPRPENHAPGRAGNSVAPRRSRRDPGRRAAQTHRHRHQTRTPNGHPAGREDPGRAPAPVGHRSRHPHPTRSRPRHSVPSAGHLASNTDIAPTTHRSGTTIPGDHRGGRRGGGGRDDAARYGRGPVVVDPLADQRIPGDDEQLCGGGHRPATGSSVGRRLPGSGTGRGGQRFAGRRPARVGTRDTTTLAAGRTAPSGSRRRRGPIVADPPCTDRAV